MVDGDSVLFIGVRVMGEQENQVIRYRHGKEK